MGKTIEAEIQPNVIVRSRGKRLYTNAHARLKLWASAYRAGSQGEIKKMTGAPYAPPSKPQGFTLSDTEEERIGAVISKLTAYNHMFVWCHYIKRPEYMDKLYTRIAQDSGETAEAYRKRIERIYFDRLGVSYGVYQSDLRDAQEEFIARGGIL